MKPISIVLVGLAFSLMGFYTFPRLAFDFGASHRSATITIQYSYPNAPPEEIERTMTTPTEAGITLLEGINEIKSEISTGSGFTRISLDQGVSLDLIRFQVAQVIRTLYVKFPYGAGYPDLVLNDPDAQEIDPAIMSYSLHGPISSYQLHTYVTQVLVPYFADIAGLQRVEIEGNEKMEYRLIYDESLLEQLGTQKSVLREVLRQHISIKPFESGFYRDRYLQFRLDRKELMDIAHLKVPVGNGNYLPLTSLVDISWQRERKSRHYRVNGRESVRVKLIPEAGTNHLKLADRVQSRAGGLKAFMPEDYRLYLEFDRTKYIRAELSKIAERTIWSLSLMLLLVILAYRNLKTSVVLVTSAGVNLGLAIIAYHLLGIQVNLYALAAITISFGIVIDNIIVMMHHYRKNRDRMVFPALLTGTLTTLSALFIIFMLPEHLKFELQEFAKVLGINLSISLIVAYLFVPAMIDLLRMNQDPAVKNIKSSTALHVITVNRLYNAFVHRIRGFRRAGLTSTIFIFGIPVFWLPNQVENWSWYNHTLGSAYYVEKIKPWTNRLLGGSLRLFSHYVSESSGFRSTEETVLMVTASMPMGSTIEQMNELMSKLEQFLGQFSHKMRAYLTTVTGGQYGQIKVLFPENGDGSFPYILKSRLEAFAVDQGGTEWNIYGVGKGFSNHSGTSVPKFRVILRGYDKVQLERYAVSLGEDLIKHPRISEFNTNANINWWEKDREEYVLVVNRKALVEKKMRFTEMKDILHSFNINPEVLSFTSTNEAVRLVSNRLITNDLWTLENRLHNIDSLRMAFGDVAYIQKSSVANSIHKENQEYLHMLSFDYTGNFRIGQRYLEECLVKLRYVLPMGYSAEQSTVNFLSNPYEKQYALVGLIAVIIFFICTIHFESFLTGLTILLLIPLSFVGIFLAFYWFDFPFDQGGYTSFLLLSGIVVNSLILIFSDYHRMKRRWPRRQSIDLYLRAFRQKITPIYLTLLSTALGLLPFAMHGSDEVFWFSLAVGTIGGLIFSLFVLWIYVPLIIN